MEVDGPANHVYVYCTYILYIYTHIFIYIHYIYDGLVASCNFDKMLICFGGHASILKNMIRIWHERIL